MLGYWEPEALAREAEQKRRALGAEFRRAREVSRRLRFWLARAVAGLAYLLWRVSERLRKGAGGGRGLEGA